VAYGTESRLISLGVESVSFVMGPVTFYVASYLRPGTNDVGSGPVTMDPGPTNLGPVANDLDPRAGDAGHMVGYLEFTTSGVGTMTRLICQ
jgi:hypothetical protein